MKDVSLVVTISESKGNDLEKIAENLGRVGLKVDRKLPTIGIISGSVSSELVEKLKKVKGVSHLREERTFSHPPMDDETPQ